MKRILVLSFVLFGFYLLPLAAAQEKPAVDKPVAEAEEIQAEEEAAVVDDEAPEGDGNFIPTEKINVDSSVSFPVDI